LLVTYWTGRFVLVVENDRNGGFVYSSLSLFVDELGKISGAYLGQVRYTEHEANGVENVGFTRPVQAGNGVEVRIETIVHRAKT
jgi:hypothetical protein